MPGATIAEPPRQVQRVGRPEEARQGIRAKGIEQGHSRERREPVGPVEKRPARRRTSPLEPDRVVPEAFRVVSVQIHGHVRVREHELRRSQFYSFDPGAEPLCVHCGLWSLGRAGARCTQAANQRQREAGHRSAVGPIDGQLLPCWRLPRTIQHPRLPKPRDGHPAYRCRRSGGEQRVPKSFRRFEQCAAAAGERGARAQARHSGRQRSRRGWRRPERSRCSHGRPVHLSSRSGITGRASAGRGDTARPVRACGSPRRAR